MVVSVGLLEMMALTGVVYGVFYCFYFPGAGFAWLE